ncbi:hypothetical protein [Ethanoligenens sp.]|uniref:hypothetical protein n=1 Tax=Ethanoligenens sp. TaxID=2099655 RepID=UPI0039EB1A80
MANKKLQQVQKNAPETEKLHTMPIKARINARQPVNAGKGQKLNPREEETFRSEPCDLFDAATPFLHMLTDQPMQSNPFSLIHRQKDIDAFVFALVRMTAWRADEYNSYWNVVCGHLYHALVGYVYYQGTLEEQNLEMILKLLKEICDEEDGAADLLFQELAKSAPDDLTVFYYHQFKDSLHTAREGVWKACVSLLRSFELFPAFGAGASEYYPISCDTADDDEEDWDDGIPDEYQEDDDSCDEEKDWLSDDPPTEDDRRHAKEHLSPFVTEDRIVRSAQTAIDLIHRAHCVHPEKMPRTDLEALNVLSNLLTTETTSAIKEHFPDEAEDVELLVLRVLRNAAERSTLMSRRIFSRRDIRVLNPLLRALFPIRF